MSKNSLLIIGLDGGSFDLIDTWVERGFLPVLGSLLKRGSRGLLRSTVPPMTFPAWNSFMTGCNPGKHGVYDFMKRRAGTLQLEVNNAASRRVPSIFQLLSHYGKRCASLGVPVTYPPEPINGVVISGFDSPFNDQRIMYPPGLYEQLRREVGPYIVTANFGTALRKGRIEESVAAMKHSIGRKFDTFLSLYRQEKWDLFMFVIGETDAVIHHFWQYHDLNSPFAPADGYAGLDPILEIYREVDRHLARFLDTLDPLTDIMVMSDHGVGGNGDHAVSINNFLASAGLMAYRHIPGSNLLNTWAEKAKALVRVTFPRSIIKQLRFRQGNRGLSFESRLRYQLIDWEKTTVFAEETPYYPAVWLNRKETMPRGIVSAEAYERIRDEIMKLLVDWRDPINGERVLRSVMRREEVYHGPATAEAPDILLSWNEPDGYSYLFRHHALLSRGNAIERVPNSVLSGDPTLINRSGSHRDHGILILTGPQIQPGRHIVDASLIDLGPTICHLLDVPVPSYVDGRILGEVITDFASRPPRYTSFDTFQQPGPFSYGASEESVVRERLRHLGYLE